MTATAAVACTPASFSFLRNVNFAQVVSKDRPKPTILRHTLEAPHKSIGDASSHDVYSDKTQSIVFQNTPHSMSTTPGTGGGGAGGGAGAGAGAGVTADDAGPAPSLATSTRHSMLLPEFHDVHKHTFRKPRTKPPRVKKPKKGGKGGRRGYRGRRRGISPSGRDVTGAPNKAAAATAASAAAAAKGGAGEPEVLNCYCGAEFTAAAGDADEGIEPVHKLVAHKNEEGHWRCRQPG